MADLKHIVPINAPPDQVYAAVATQAIATEAIDDAVAALRALKKERLHF